MNADQRQQIASSAGQKLERADLAGSAALIGFDGAIDEIIRVVDRRREFRPGGGGRYDPIPDIPAFAARIASAAGKSSNLELVVNEVRFGGNGPLMSSAVSGLGAPVTYIGSVGRRDAVTELDPVFEPFAPRCRSLIPLAAPALTSALEFDDGKIMLGKLQSMQELTWETLLDGLGGGDADAGRKRIADMVGGASLIGLVNWVMMAGAESIWEGLIDEVLPALTTEGAGARRRRVFVDLCDPAKRTDEDIRRALGVLERMNGLAPVTLGLNLAEAERIAGVAGVASFGCDGDGPSEPAIERDTSRVREALGLSCVVVHPRHGAAAADAQGTAWIDGPFVRAPRLSTGAGDHFNGGFAVAQVLGLEPAECLAVGVATSGAYVRDAASPTRKRVVEFLRDLPAPEPAGANRD